jgi:hypothetical protein
MLQCRNWKLATQNRTEQFAGSSYKVELQAAVPWDGLLFLNNFPSILIQGGSNMTGTICV